MDQQLENRRKRRFPVKDLTISFNGKTYRVFNINEYGVGFLLDAPDEIPLDTEIAPMIVNSPDPVRVAGIPRHISHYASQEKPLFFKSGWVCGAEFSTRHNRDGGKLLATFIAENISPPREENE